MPVTLSRAPVVAVLLDETQRLNPPEQGTVENFGRAAAEVGKSLEPRTLSAALRCRGGEPYHQWLEELLEQPHEALTSLQRQPWREAYYVGFCRSVEELRDRLGLLRDATHAKVALVASFTESPGFKERAAHPDNVRVGWPLSSGFDIYKDSQVSLRWLMQDTEYANYWMSGRSNQLDRVASIYGAQGFESDFVGVIWGRDWVLNDGLWELGPPDVCYDTTDGLVRRGKGRQWSPEAPELVRNRYRIFLTRGIRGTLVFFEDEATRSKVLSLVG